MLVSMFQKMTILVTFFLSCSVFIGMSKCKFHVSDYKKRLAKFLLILNEFQRLKSTKMILNRFLSWCVREVPRLWRVQRWGQHLTENTYCIKDFEDGKFYCKSWTCADPDCPEEQQLAQEGSSCPICPGTLYILLKYFPT